MKLLTLITIVIILITGENLSAKLMNSDNIEGLEMIDAYIELQDEQKVQEYKKILESADDSTYGGYYRGENQSDIVVNILPGNLYIPIIDNPHISYNEVSYSLSYLEEQKTIIRENADELHTLGYGIQVRENCVLVWIDEEYTTDETAIKEQINNIPGIDSKAIKIKIMHALPAY